jgi:hypothetical protein
VDADGDGWPEAEDCDDAEPVDGPEDLAIDPLRGWMWSATEDVGNRQVFAISLTDVGG